MEKILYPKRKARISLQFYLDETKLLNLLVTVQPGKDIDDIHSMDKVGREFYMDKKHCTRSERKAIAWFCRGYLEQYKKNDPYFI